MSHVSSASYPIAQQLATLLNTAISEEAAKEKCNDDNDNSRLPPLEIDVECKADALQHFIRNCFVAMDDVFFST